MKVITYHNKNNSIKDAVLYWEGPGHYQGWQKFNAIQITKVEEGEPFAYFCETAEEAAEGYAGHEI